MPSFEDVTPTVLQNSVPQESTANMKNKALEIISFLLFWVQLLFSQKVGSWGLCSPLSVNVTQTHSWGVRRIENEKDPHPLLWLGRCVVRESHKHICAWPSHTFVLPRIQTQPRACVRRPAMYARSFTQTLTNVDSCTLTKQGSRHNCKQKKRFCTCTLNKTQTCSICSTTALSTSEQHCTVSIRQT